MKAIGWMYVVLLASGCSEEFALVSIEDPNAVARGANRIELANGQAAPVSHSLDKSFPVTLTLTSASGSPVELKVRVYRDTKLLAQATASVALSSGTEPVRVGLQKACGGDEDCTDGRACNGVERCVDSQCLASTEPLCPASPFACVVTTCDEEADACVHRPDSTLCPAASDGMGPLPVICKQDQGCVTLSSCSRDLDCDDRLACSGVESCVSGRCTVGPLPVIDDLNSCTQDSCTEPAGLVHARLPDASSCTLESGRESACYSGVCGGACGDPLVQAGEQCELVSGVGCTECTLDRLMGPGEYSQISVGAPTAQVLTLSVRSWARVVTYAPSFPDCLNDTILEVRRIGSGIIANSDDDSTGSLCAALCADELDLEAGEYVIATGPYDATSEFLFGVEIETGRHTCGDGVVSGNEQCDDGNDRDGDLCSRECRLIPQTVLSQHREFMFPLGSACSKSVLGVLFPTDGTLNIDVVCGSAFQEGSLAVLEDSGFEVANIPLCSGIMRVPSLPAGSYQVVARSRGEPVPNLRLTAWRE